MTSILSFAYLRVGGRRSEGLGDEEWAAECS